MILRDLTHLEAAINEESWEWLVETAPGMAEALRRQVAEGAGPEEVRRYAMRLTQRPALALRLRQAAAHLSAGGGSG